MVLQSRIALKPKNQVSYEGVTYSGTPVFEHPVKATEDAGFTSVLEAQHPRPAFRLADPVLLAAIAGEIRPAALGLGAERRAEGRS